MAAPPNTMTMNQRALNDALARLPHGPEFKFLDRLLSLEPGKRGVAEYRVPTDAHFLKGHFPGQPIFPGVLLVEAAAQLAGTVAQSDPAVSPLPGLKLTGLRAIKILGAARPGDVLHIEATLTARLGDLVQADATVRCADRLLLQGSITLSGDTPQTNVPK